MQREKGRGRQREEGGEMEGRKERGREGNYLASFEDLLLFVFMSMSVFMAHVGRCLPRLQKSEVKLQAVVSCLAC